MKKYLFLLAGLLMLAATNQAEARAEKLGRLRLLSAGDFNGVNVGGGGIDPIPPEEPCGGCRHPSTNICTTVEAYNSEVCVPAGKTAYNNNGTCACQNSTPSCTDDDKCLDGSNCILISNYSGCSPSQTRIKKSDNTCGCQNCGSGNCINENGNCTELTEYQINCEEGYIAVSDNGQCACVPNNYCAGVLCNSGYTPVAEQEGCHCVAEPEPPAQNCEYDYIYHPVLHFCVDAYPDDLNCLVASAYADYCMFCKPGYYVSTHAGCKPCTGEEGQPGVEHCRMCTNTGPTHEGSWVDGVVCVLCNDGYTLMSDGTCVQ